MRFPNFVGGSATGQSVILDAEDTVNYYVEQALSRGAANGSALFPTPGFSAWGRVGKVGSRASLYAEGRLFFVIGDGFYEFDSTGTATLRGTVVVDANPAQIIYNGKVGGHLGIASGGNAYCFVLATNAFTQTLTGECTQIAYSSGFGLAFNLATGHVRLSPLNDLTSWSANFYQRSLSADPYQAMFVDSNNLVWMLGTDTFEVRYNSGVGNQPFVPLSGLVGPYGIASSFAFAVNAAGNFWLARNKDGIGQFVASTGSVPEPVSTYSFDTNVARYLRSARISDAEVLSYQQEGHTFLSVSFPSVPATWAYDAEGKSWARRGAWNPTQGRFELWAPRVHAQAFGLHLIGDRSTGIVSTMDTNLATEVDGSGIVRERTAPGLLSEHKRQPIDQFELLMDVGLGLPSGQGSDPQITLRVSEDGGRTFGSERQASLGRLGEYRKRVYWTQLGAPAHAVLRVRVSDPLPSRILDAYLNNQEGQRAA